MSGRRTHEIYRRKKPWSKAPNRDPLAEVLTIVFALFVFEWVGLTAGALAKWESGASIILLSYYLLLYYYMIITWLNILLLLSALSLLLVVVVVVVGGGGGVVVVV